MYNYSMEHHIYLDLSSGSCSPDLKRSRTGFRHDSVCRLSLIHI